jgi:hypothetical protein
VVSKAISLVIRIIVQNPIERKHNKFNSNLLLAWSFRKCSLLCFPRTEDPRSTFHIIISLNSISLLRDHRRKNAKFLELNTPVYRKMIVPLNSLMIFRSQSIKHVPSYLIIHFLVWDLCRWYFDYVDKWLLDIFQQNKILPYSHWIFFRFSDVRKVPLWR